MRARTYTDEEFIEAVKESVSVRQVLAKLNLKHTGGNYQQFYRNVESLGLDTSHFTGQIHHTPQTAWNKKDISTYLVIGKTKGLSPRQRNFIFENNLLGTKCVWCSLQDNWNGKPLKLQIDHINGNRRDNRLENLRLLCPNCHSQTETYGGNNKKLNNIANGTEPDIKLNDRRVSYKKDCIDCGKKVYREALRCKACNNKYVSNSAAPRT
jgi:Zn finger protein HypA/HybF involved in hydrogenase expression